MYIDRFCFCVLSNLSSHRDVVKHIISHDEIGGIDIACDFLLALGFTDAGMPEDEFNKQYQQKVDFITNKGMWYFEFF